MLRFSRANYLKPLRVNMTPLQGIDAAERVAPSPNKITGTVVSWNVVTKKGEIEVKAEESPAGEAKPRVQRFRIEGPHSFETLMPTMLRTLEGASVAFNTKEFPSFSEEHEMIREEKMFPTGDKLPISDRTHAMMKDKKDGFAGLADLIFIDMDTVERVSSRTTLPGQSPTPKGIKKFVGDSTVEEYLPGTEEEALKRDEEEEEQGTALATTSSTINKEEQKRGIDMRYVTLPPSSEFKDLRTSSLFATGTDTSLTTGQVVTSGPVKVLSGVSGATVVKSATSVSGGKMSAKAHDTKGAWNLSKQQILKQSMIKSVNTYANEATTSAEDNAWIQALRDQDKSMGQGGRIPTMVEKLRRSQGLDPAEAEEEGGDAEADIDSSSHWEPMTHDPFAPMTNEDSLYGIIVAWSSVHRTGLIVCMPELLENAEASSNTKPGAQQQKEKQKLKPKAQLLDILSTLDPTESTASQHYIIQGIHRFQSLMPGNAELRGSIVKFNGLKDTRTEGGKLGNKFAGEITIEMVSPSAVRRQNEVEIQRASNVEVHFASKSIRRYDSETGEMDSLKIPKVADVVRKFEDDEAKEAYASRKSAEGGAEAPAEEEKPKRQFGVVGRFSGGQGTIDGASGETFFIQTADEFLARSTLTLSMVRGAIVTFEVDPALPRDAKMIDVVSLASHNERLMRQEMEKGHEREKRRAAVTAARVARLEEEERKQAAAASAKVETEDEKSNQTKQTDPSAAPRSDDANVEWSYGRISFWSPHEGTAVLQLEVPKKTEEELDQEEETGVRPKARRTRFLIRKISRECENYSEETKRAWRKGTRVRFTTAGGDSSLALKVSLCPVFCTVPHPDSGIMETVEADEFGQPVEGAFPGAKTQVHELTEEQQKEKFGTLRTKLKSMESLTVDSQTNNGFEGGKTTPTSGTSVLGEDEAIVSPLSTEHWRKKLESMNVKKEYLDAFNGEGDNALMKQAMLDGEDVTTPRSMEEINDPNMYTDLERDPKMKEILRSPTKNPEVPGTKARYMDHNIFASPAGIRRLAKQLNTPQGRAKWNKKIERELTAEQQEEAWLKAKDIAPRIRKSLHDRAVARGDTGFSFD